MPTWGTFDGRISLAKGIILTKIGLANGHILKLWVAHPYLKFNRELPVGAPNIFSFSFLKLYTTVNQAVDQIVTTSKKAAKKDPILMNQLM